MVEFKRVSKRKPGVCMPWEEKLKEYEESRGGKELKGDKEMVKRIHEQIDFLAYLYIWHCLLSF